MAPCSFQLVEDRLEIGLRFRRADFILQLCEDIKEVTGKKRATIRRVLGSDDFVWLQDNTSGAEEFQVLSAVQILSLTAESGEL